MKPLDEMFKDLSIEDDDMVDEGEVEMNLLDDPENDDTEDNNCSDEDEEDDSDLGYTVSKEDEPVPVDMVKLSFDDVNYTEPATVTPSVKPARKQGPRANKRFANIPSDREATIKQKFSVFTRATSENYRVQWEKVKLATMTHGEINKVLSREVSAESFLKSKGVVPSA